MLAIAGLARVALCSTGGCMGGVQPTRPPFQASALREPVVMRWITSGCGTPEAPRPECVAPGDCDTAHTGLPRPVVDVVFARSDPVGPQVSQPRMRGLGGVDPRVDVECCLVSPELEHHQLVGVESTLKNLKLLAAGLCCTARQRSAMARASSVPLPGLACVVMRGLSSNGAENWVQASSLLDRFSIRLKNKMHLDEDKASSPRVAESSFG